MGHLLTNSKEYTGGCALLNQRNKQENKKTIQKTGLSKLEKC